MLVKYGSLVGYGTLERPILLPWTTVSYQSHILLSSGLTCLQGVFRRNNDDDDDDHNNNDDDDDDDKNRFFKQD